MSVKFKGFRYVNYRLLIDEVDIESIIEKVGTPCYIYSADQIQNNFLELDQAFKDRDHCICYAVKANSSLAVLNLLANLGAGAEVVSGGELFRALEAGFPPDKIIFDGVGKTREEIDYAIRKKILYFNVESEQELVMIDVVAKEHKKVASVSFRINPDVNPKTHPYIATGLKKSKFGISYRKAPEIIKTALRLKNIHVMGLGCHIGSQITTLAPYQESVGRIVELYDKALSWGADLTHINVGGGLGITYKSERPPTLTSWAQAVMREVGDRDVTVLTEPGRCLVGNAGALITRVNYVKRSDSTNYIIIDSGMNDLLRPSLYQAYHQILPVRYKRYKKLKASVVGPVCESGDIIASDRRIQNFQQNDLLAIMSCGAYAATMGSQYNSRPRPPEVMVTDSKFYVIRERETYDDLIQREKVPAALKKLSANLSVV